MKKSILINLNNYVIIPILITFFFKIAYDILNSINHSFYVPSIIFSYIIIVCLFLIFLGITGKSFIAYIVVITILTSIFIVNQIKIIYVGEPLFFSDFSFVTNAKSLVSYIENSFLEIFISHIKYLIITILFLAILLLYIFKFNLKIYSLKRRLIFLLISTFTLIILFIPTNLSKKYLNYFFLGEKKLDYSSFTNYKSVYSMYGIYGGMYSQLLDNRFNKPDNYDDNLLNKILENKKEKTEEKIGTPNIVVILSESFFDINFLKDDITFDKDVTYNFNKLKVEGDIVNLISPTYGGMTANVTFELLTGANMSYFHSGYIPFMQLYNNKKSNKPSIIKDLTDNDYNCEVILAQDSYNSSRVFYELGFSKYTKLEKKKKNTKGYYISDEYVTDLIIDKLKQQKKEKNFYLIETMQSHMDYSIDKYTKYDISIKDSNLSNKDNETLLSYAQGIYDADKMLKKIYDYIKNINEKTIVVFFGDHLPYLKNSDGENIMEKLSYFNTKDELLNQYRKYNTQAIILSNYKYNISFPENLGFDALLTYIANNMNIELSPYYYWLYADLDNLPAYNRYIAIDNNKKLNFLNELNKKSSNTYDLRKQMMYKMFIK